jgi:hypothetical protein
MEVRVLGAIREVPAAEWNALVADESPFLEWDFLAALEDASTVTSGTGWLPQHLTLFDGARLVGACPTYLKAHSMGEFVFDHTWAQAAHRAGIEYYPKLLVAVPFTPVTGARFLARPDDAALVRKTLGAVLERLCEKHEFSSAHVNFCRPPEVAALAERGWLQRTGYQYQWRNDGFATFDDYLASLRSKRRNQVRRERRELEAQGVVITSYLGADVPADVAPLAYRLYRATIDDNPWGHRYLTPRFFQLAVERFRDRLCLILARQNGEVVAGTVNVQKGDALYGRYWGALRDLRYLHFNVCYYAAIEHCIRHKLARFEPGAGGEFKHLRGFDATETVSMHWIREKRFRAAVADYLGREREAVTGAIEWYGEKTALRRDRPDEEEE